MYGEMPTSGKVCAYCTRHKAIRQRSQIAAFGLGGEKTEMKKVVSTL